MEFLSQWQVIIGVLIPFIGTTLGSAFVFLLKKEIKTIIQKIMLGFAAGVMIAASVWSLLVPAIEMAEEQGKMAWIPATIGFMVGVLSLIAVNNIAEKMEYRAKENNAKKEKNEIKLKEKVKSTTMLTLAVTLHNIPEGMAVGVGFAGLMSQSAGITLLEAFALAIGIAIHSQEPPVWILSTRLIPCYDGGPQKCGRRDKKQEPLHQQRLWLCKKTGINSRDACSYEQLRTSASASGWG